jgi:hypothetical protein
VKNARFPIGVAAAIGLAVLAHRIGLKKLASQMRDLGVVLPIVLAAGVARLLLQTRAWWIALRAEGIVVPHSRLIGVRLASQAAGYLSVGPAVSEPATLMMLQDRGAMAAAAPAILMETGAYWVTTVMLGLVGACASAFLIADARLAWVAIAIFGGALALLMSRRSLLTPLVRLAGSRTPRWLRSAEQGELRIRSFRERRPAAARSVLILDAIAQVVTLFEVAMVLRAAGFRFNVAQVVAIEAAGRIVKMLGAWIPGRIGADESGAAASFALLGLSPAAGLMLAVARRARDLLWCAAGVLWAGTRTEAAKSAPLQSRLGSCLLSGARKQAAVTTAEPATASPVALCLEER